MKAVGIDLAGKEDNSTGIAILENHDIRTDILYSDNEITEMCKSEDPKIVAMDAPLSFPEEGGLREADSELINRGHRVLPPALGGMESLTRRGIRLSKRLDERGFEVIEIHPRTSGRILFGSGSRDDWISKLEDEGWRPDSKPTEHEIDSVLAAITGLLYLEGKTEKVGKSGKEIIIPRARSIAP